MSFSFFSITNASTHDLMGENELASVCLDIDIRVCLRGAYHLRSTVRRPLQFSSLSFTESTPTQYTAIENKRIARSDICTANIIREYTLPTPGVRSDRMMCT